MHVRGTPAKKQLTRELAILNHPYFQSRRPSLLSQVNRLQQARTRRHVDELQIELIAELGAIEKVVPEIEREHGDNPRNVIERLKLVAPKTANVKASLRDAQELLHRIEQADIVGDAVRHVVRVIADGLAWRLLEFDRTALAILADREVVARHAPEAGFKAEMDAMDEIGHALNTIVLHNDSTYCLRHGDVTAVVEIDGRRFPYPVEVKAGQSHGARQKRAIRMAIEQIVEGRLLVPVEFSTHLGLLKPMIQEARATGYASMKRDCRFIQVIDYRHFGEREDRVRELVDQADRDLGWTGGDRLILAGIAGASRIYDRGDPVSELAPLSIFPLPADDIVDLLMGAIDLRVHLNTELLALAFGKRGITVEFARGEAARRHFLHARRGYKGLNVPAYVREQMLAELLTSEALIDLVEWVLDSNLTVEWARTEQTPVIAFADECPAWVGGAQKIALTPR